MGKTTGITSALHLRNDYGSHNKYCVLNVKKLTSRKGWMTGWATLAGSRSSIKVMTISAVP